MNKRALAASKRVKKRTEPSPKRSRVTTALYLDSALFKAFKKEADKMNKSASLLFEEFMREFLGK